MPSSGCRRVDTDLQEETEQTERQKVRDRKCEKSQKDGVRKMGTGGFNHGWTRMDTDLQEETEQTERQKVRDRKCEKSQKDGSSNQIL